MKVVNERSAIASYDLGMRTRAQLRDTTPSSASAMPGRPRLPLRRVSRVKWRG